MAAAGRKFRANSPPAHQTAGVVLIAVLAMPRRHCPVRRLRFGPVTRVLALPLVVLLSLALLAPAGAEERSEGPHSRLPESVRRVERETGGKVLQVRPIQRGDREIYRMKVLTPDGRVKIMQDDPKRQREPRPREREAPPAPP